eukprot:468209-Prymnesium_polylepis.1
MRSPSLIFRIRLRPRRILPSCRRQRGVARHACDAHGSRAVRSARGRAMGLYKPNTSRAYAHDQSSRLPRSH